jgi:hypothetical protein
MGMLEVTCVPAIMEETLIREYTVNLPTSHSFLLQQEEEREKKKRIRKMKIKKLVIFYFSLSFSSLPFL